MIIINGRFLMQTITGVQRFAIELCERLPNSIGGEEVLFVTPKSDRIFSLKGNKRILQCGSLQGNLWEQIDLPKFLLRYKKPLLINLVGIGPVFYRNKILALYDLAFKHYPKWFSYSFQKTYNFLIPISIKNSICIITDSNYVKNDISRSYGVKKNKIEVVYAAVSEKFKKIDCEKEKIILTVSSLDPRKNLKSVIDAYKQIDTEYKLVVVGKSHANFSKAGIEIKAVQSGIRFTGYLSDEELLVLYNTATIFIYASFFEGFGIPPLEAQACGCSCIVSNTTCFPEIYQDSVHYCNPNSVESIKESIESLIEDDNRVKELQKIGYSNVKRFDWSKSASELEQLIIRYNS